MASSLNLRQSLVEQFWQTQDPSMCKLLHDMSHNEFWRLDTAEAVAEALGTLTIKLERASPEVLLAALPRLIHLMAYLSSPRAMYLLEWLSNRHEALALLLLEQAARMENDRCAMLLIDRVQTIKSMSLLGAVFSPENVQNVKALLEQITRRS